jgi:cell division protein FtsL
VKVRGRVWLGLWLLLFLVVSLLIVARQRAALVAAGELSRLRETRLALEAERAEYQRRIREGSSQRVLVPRAGARLGLRMPSDREYLNFEIPAPGGGAP